MNDLDNDGGSFKRFVTAQGREGNEANRQASASGAVVIIDSDEGEGTENWLHFTD